MRSRHAPLVLVLVSCVSCGPSAPAGKTAKGAAGATVSCPAPVGTIAREDCTAIADDFGAFTVAQALKSAGSTRADEDRIAAIKATEALAASIKEQRVRACEQLDACALAPKDHDAEDARLTAAMKELIALWDARRLSRADEIAGYRTKLDAIEKRVNPPATEAAKTPAEAKTTAAASAFARTDDPAIGFHVDGATLKLESKAEGEHDAVASVESVELPSGKRVRVRLLGSYAPATPPLVAPGDELVVRLKLAATDAGELAVALRSLEDPDASEATSSIAFAAGDKGAREVTLAAAPQQSGFSLAITSKRDARVDLDDVEVVRGGAVIAAARAESPEDGWVKATCAIATKKPIAGKGSYACTKAGELFAIGAPKGHVALSIESRAQGRVTTRALSLDGGRSVEAILKAPGRVVVTLVGPGSATLRSLEVTTLDR